MADLLVHLHISSRCDQAWFVLFLCCEPTVFGSRSVHARVGHCALHGFAGRLPFKLHPLGFGSICRPCTRRACRRLWRILLVRSRACGARRAGPAGCFVHLVCQALRRRIRAVLASMQRHSTVAVAVRGRPNSSRITYTAYLGCASNVFLPWPHADVSQEYRDGENPTSTTKFLASGIVLEGLAGSYNVQQRLAVEIARFRDAVGHRSRCAQASNVSNASGVCANGPTDAPLGLAVLQRRLIQRSHSSQSHHRPRLERPKLRSLPSFSEQGSRWHALETFLLWLFHVIWYLWSPLDHQRGECTPGEEEEAESADALPAGCTGASSDTGASGIPGESSTGREGRRGYRRRKTT